LKYNRGKGRGTRIQLGATKTVSCRKGGPAIVGNSKEKKKRNLNFLVAGNL